MYTLMIVIFVLGYAAIALEHNIKIDKAASALLTGTLSWTILIFGADGILGIDYAWTLEQFKEMIANGEGYLKSFKAFAENLAISISGSEQTVKSVTNHYLVHELQHHVIEIAEILFFLIGAMTIVEVIDAHEGFSVITDRIKTTKKITLIWILSILTFFFSAALDNLTTAIVMSALLKKLIEKKNDRWMFAGVIIIAANAGGAWSPIGDVTTIMLWIGGQITAANVVYKVFLPSVVAILVPLGILTFTMKGHITRPKAADEEHDDYTSPQERKLVFFLGVAALIQVPIFKTVTHMPPFMGVLLGLAVLWIVTEILHKKKSLQARSKLSVIYVLKKIDTPSVLFFLGILVAVASLQTAGHLIELAGILEKSIGNIYVINVIIGLLSSIVDNVPLVAAAMGMYAISPEVVPGVSYPVDHEFWEFLAYCAGTGGSCLIIGSAAGVAVMGILKIDFVWYVRKISLLALAGYLAGAATFYLMFGGLFS